MLLHILSYIETKEPSKVQMQDLELLKRSAESKGHKIKLIFFRDCQLKFNRNLSVLYKNKYLNNIKILLVKANFLDPGQYGTTIKQFELAGVPIINKYSAVMRAKNKVKTLQSLAKRGIPMPKSYVVRSSGYIKEMVEKIGYYPVIIKSISGSYGYGVSIVESQRGLRSVIELLVQNESSAPIIIQEYVKESSGKDIRVIVLAKKAVAAMERISTQRGEFRSNFHLGGKVRLTELTIKEKEVAVSASRACGLDMAGVDIIRTRSGPKVLEVNANPGLVGITQATSRDIAGEVINYMIRRARR